MRGAQRRPFAHDNLACEERGDIGWISEVDIPQ